MPQKKQHGMLQIKAGASSNPKWYIVQPVSVNKTYHNPKNRKRNVQKIPGVVCVRSEPDLTDFSSNCGRRQSAHIIMVTSPRATAKPPLDFAANVSSYYTSKPNPQQIWPRHNFSPESKKLFFCFLQWGKKKFQLNPDSLELRHGQWLNAILPILYSTRAKPKWLPWCHPCLTPLV